MKKVAFVSGWYVFNGQKGIHPIHKFVLECLYKSAKKFFLKEHNVDFIFITNDETIKIDDVKNVVINHKVDGFWYMCLMKILSLKYLEEEYDYIFVNDTDQIFVNEIGDELLKDNFYLLNHFYYPTIESIYRDITPPVEKNDIVPLNFENKNDYWTMGNFFGGKSELMKNLCSFTETQHNLYVREKYHPDFHFYTRYPEELFLIKYIYENKISHTRLHANGNPKATGMNYFMGDFYDKENIYPNIPEIRIIHNTKKNVELLKEIMQFYS